MFNNNFVLSYYKNASSGMHIQRVNESKEATKPHTHEYFQIYYVVKGSLEHYTKDDFSTLSQGDMFIIPPNSVHYINHLDGAVFYTFSFMPESLGKVDSVNKLTLNFLNSLSKNNLVKAKITIPISEALTVNEIMEKLYKEFNEKKLAYEEVMRAYAIVLITLFARIYYENLPEHASYSLAENREQVLHCINYIRYNYMEDFSLNEMSKRCAMSKSVFCKLFKDISGKTFNEFVNYTRITNAKSLIKQNYKMVDVCSLCGYTDFTTFYRNFKKITGKSPKDFVKE